MTIYTNLCAQHLLCELLLNKAYSKSKLAKELEMSVHQLNSLLISNPPKKLNSQWESRLAKLVNRQHIMLPPNESYFNTIAYGYRS